MLSAPPPKAEFSDEQSVVSPPMIERRVRRVTCVVTVGAALVGTAVCGWSVGGGVALGGGLSYLNFLWMRQSLYAMITATTAGGTGRPSHLQMAKFFLRWVVIGALIWFVVQVASDMAVAVVCGLFALPLAVVAEAFVQVWHGERCEPAA